MNVTLFMSEEDIEKVALTGKIMQAKIYDNPYIENRLLKFKI